MKTLLQLLEENPNNLLQQIQSLEEMDILALNEHSEHALIVACRMDNYEVAEYLLSHFISLGNADFLLTTTSHEGYTALMWACMLNNGEMVKLLLNFIRYIPNGAELANANKGSDPLKLIIQNTIQKVNPLTHERALALAARVQAINAISALLECALKQFGYFFTNEQVLYSEDSEHLSALNLALEHENIELIEKLITPLIQTYGINFIFQNNMLQSWEVTPIHFILKHKKPVALAYLQKIVPPEEFKKRIEEILFSAIKKQDENSVAILQPVINVVDKSSVLLSRAIVIGNRPIVQMLLEGGFRPNPSPNKKGQYMNDQYSFVEYDPNYFPGNTAPLTYAAMGNDIHMIDLLLDYGADVNFQVDTAQPTALTTAVYQEKPAAVNMLLARGANLNQADSRGTPLMQVNHHHSEVIIPLLLSRGADPYEYNSKGDNILTHYVQRNALKPVKVLLEQGIDPNRENAQGKKPLELAIQGRNSAMVKAIGDASGCDFNIRSEEAKTMLFLALELHDFDIATYLIEKRQNVNEFAKDVKKMTLLHHFCKTNDGAVVSFLLRQGASTKNTDILNKTPIEYANAATSTVFYEWELKKKLPNQAGNIPISKKILGDFIAIARAQPQPVSALISSQGIFANNQVSLIELLEHLFERCQESDKLEAKEYRALKVILDDYARGLIQKNSLSDAIQDVILTLVPFSLPHIDFQMGPDQYINCVDTLFQQVEHLPFDAESKAYLSKIFLPGIRAMIVDEEKIIDHMILPTSEIYMLHPELPLHTKEPRTTDREKIRQHLHTILNNVLGAAQICTNKGLLYQFLDRIYSEKRFSCVEGRTREPLDWVANEVLVERKTNSISQILSIINSPMIQSFLGWAAQKLKIIDEIELPLFDDLMRKYIYEEYIPYAELIQGMKEEEYYHVTPAIAFIMLRYARVQCQGNRENDPQIIDYAPDGVVCPKYAQKFLEEQLYFASDDKSTPELSI